MKVKSFITLTLELQLPMMTSSHFRRIRFRQVRCRLKRRQFAPPSNKTKTSFLENFDRFSQTESSRICINFFTLFGT
jgi:hypothetical protein